ncbi:MAG: tryptophan-rich sensory protein [Chloroflexota bacterium]|nr:tryptophan-rich sensory protein [Chloroflexota bacterium]
MTAKHTGQQNPMWLIILNIVAAVGTVVYNSLSQIIPIGVATNAELANRLPIYFFPANFTFSIWGVIFISWIVYAVYQALPAQRSNPFVRAVGVWFALSSLGNIGWLLAFQYEQFALSMLPIVWLLVTLGVAYVRIRQVDAPMTTADYWCISVPFSIYFAWSAVATVANTSYTIYSSAGLTPDSPWLGITQQAWGAIMLVVAGVITSAVAFINRDIAYIAVIVWAFVGIIARYPEVQAVALTAGAVAGIGALLVLVYTLMMRGRTALSLR